MGVFSRIGDILNANIVHMLDRAEDPEKMVRLIIQEMEDTLVEVKSTAAKIISEKKTIERQEARHQSEAADWQRKATFALDKDREDLARGALAERLKAEELAAGARQRLQALEEDLVQLRSDIATLSDKLSDARERQQTIILKRQALLGQSRVQETLARSGAQRAYAKFEQFEANLDRMAGDVEAARLMASNKTSLGAALHALEHEGRIDDELSKLRASKGDEIDRKDATSKG